MNKSNLSHPVTPAIVVGLLLFIPIIVSFYYIGTQTIFNLFAADSMYYMGIANNFLKFGIPTFDGETVINGFHPLWELVLIGMFKILSIKHYYQIYAVFALSALLVYTAYITISHTLVKIVGARPGLVATFTLFPGAYSIFFAPQRHLFNAPGTIGTFSPCSAINGMETSLSLTLWALFFFTTISRFRVLSQEKNISYDVESFFPFSTRICLALIVLSRLDDCFLVISLSVFVLSLNDISFQKKINSLIHILLPTVVVLLIYITFNELTAGSLLPVSGTSKTSFAITGNLHNLFMVLTGQSGIMEWWYLAYCFYSIILALLVGTSCIFVGRRFKNLNSVLPENSLMMSLLNVFGWFLVLKALFLFIFVPVVHQGYWYYFPMVVICNVIFAIAVGFYIKNNNKNTLAVLFVSLAVIFFRMPNEIYLIKSSTDHNTPNYATISYALWNNGDEIRKFLAESAPNAKLIDNLDGMYVYLLDIPGDSITGLASSSKELTRRKEIGVMPSLVSRGFSILPSYGYMNPNALPQNIRIVDVFNPPSSPVSFYRVALTTGTQ